MTLTELQKLIAENKGEWERLEFKRTTGELQGGMETLCAFLNGTGGNVVFGVNTAGTIQGQDVSDNTFQDIANAIRKLEPPADVEQIRIGVGGSKEVVMLSVSQHPHPPCTFDGRAFKRVGNTTTRIPQEEYERRLLKRTRNQYPWEGEVAEGWTIDGLDAGEIERTLKAAVEAGRLDATVTTPLDALDRFHVRVDGRLLRAAVVLFGRDPMPDYPQCALRLARFKGTNKTEFIDQKQMHGQAFRLLDEAMTFIMRHIPVAGRIEPGKLERTDTPLYPPLALREALVNALCHRDYVIAGGAVNVAIFDDRLEVISSGLLPPGITVADLKRKHVSHPRNPLIAEVFYRRKLVEQWGRGTQKIVDWCVEAGQPEPEFEEGAGAMTVRFLPSGYHPPLRVSHDLTDRQRQILLILSDRQKWQVGDILRALKNRSGLRAVQVDLARLREYALVRSSGRGGNARWWLAEANSGIPSASPAHSQRTPSASERSEAREKQKDKEGN